MTATFTHGDPAFVTIGDLDEVLPGTARAVVVGNNAVAIFRVGGGFLALDDGCLHCGTSLASGWLCSGHVICPQCHWRYELTSGRVEGVPGLHADAFEVRVAGSVVELCTVPKPFPQNAR